MIKTRRRITNIFVFQRGQFKLMIPFLILPVTSTILMYYLHFKVSKMINITLSNQNSVIPELTQSVRSLQLLTTFGAAGVLVLSLAAFVLYVLYSHRLLGPIVAIERHVQSLCQGDYSSLIALRNYDEWKNVASGLNQVTEMLKQSKEK